MSKHGLPDRTPPVSFAVRFPGRSGRLVLFALLGVNLLLRCVVALRPLEYIDGLTVPDDAYLSLTIAKNIAEGIGPLYGLEYTNGFQPLYVFLMVPVYWIVHGDLVTPVHIALILLSLFDTATLFLLFRLLATRSTSFSTPLVAAALWILNPYVISTTLNGLETAISCFFIAAVVWYFSVRTREPSGLTPGKDFVLGLLLGGAVFARIDNLLLALAAGIIILLQNIRQPHGVSSSLWSLLVIGAGMFLVNVPWLVYSYHYTGDLYPVSGKAVRFMSLAQVGHQPTLDNWYWGIMKRGVLVILESNIPALVCVGGLGAAAIVFRRRVRATLLPHLHWLSLPALFVPFLFFGYTLYIFTPWFFDRYFYPAFLVLLLLCAVLFDGVSSALRSQTWRTFLTAALLVVIAATPFTSRKSSDLFFSRETTNMGYMNIGVWAKKQFPAGTILGSSQTGALGYFAEGLTVINLDGVVNKSCYESLVERRNMEYIRSVRIEYVVGWPVNIQFIVAHSANFRKGDLVLVGRLEEFRSWESDWYLLKVRY